MTSIEEAYNLSKFSIDILIGKLLTHELTLKQTEYEKDEKEEKNKSITLKASQNDSEKESLEDSSDV